MELTKYKLGDIADISVGFPFESERFNEDGDGVRLVRGMNVSERMLRFGDESRWWSDITENLEPYFLKENDIVIGMDGSKVGKNFALIKQTDLPLLLVQRVACIRAKKGFDQNYIWHYVSSPRFIEYVNTIKTGSAIPHISGKQIGEFPIFVPPLPEQKKIASVLSALDDKIALNKKMNQKLEAMAKRLYDYWFVQFDFPDKNGRPYKTTGGPMTYNPTLKREIPAGWEVSLVSDVIKPIDRGISYTSENIKDSSGVPMINLACFDKKGNYRTGELKFYSGEYDASNKVYPLDMLIACTDLTQKADIIGTPIFLSAEAPFYVFSTDLAKITPKKESHKYFLYYYLKNPTFHRYIKPFASGTTVKHLNVKGVENYPIFIPDEKVVKQFTESVRPMVIAINERINEINRLTALRDKLLPLLMNGQVVVAR